MQTKKELTLINEYKSVELTLEYLHDNDLDSRLGYDENFLGRNNLKVPLPKLFNDDFGKIAKNKRPGRSGEDYLDYEHFSTMHNARYKLPYFTAVNNNGLLNYLAMDHDERSGDKWNQDPRIISGNNSFQFTDKDYKYSGFQKGHMVRFYDPAWGNTEEEQKIAIGDTFYYTNCCPQLGKFNVGKWLDLENYSMLKAVFETDRVSIFCGPVFSHIREIKNLNVPVTYWKIIVYKNHTNLEAIGFIMSQKLAFDKRDKKILDFAEFIREGKKPSSLKPEDIETLWNKKNLRRYQVKIELIEEKTNLKFGLNNIDVNRNKDLYHFEDVDAQYRRFTKLVEHKRVEDQELFNDLEFIKSL